MICHGVGFVSYCDLWTGYSRFCLFAFLPFGLLLALLLALALALLLLLLLQLRVSSRSFCFQDVMLFGRCCGVEVEVRSNSKSNSKIKTISVGQVGLGKPLYIRFYHCHIRIQQGIFLLRLLTLPIEGNFGITARDRDVFCGFESGVNRCLLWWWSCKKYSCVVVSVFKYTV